MFLFAFFFLALEANSPQAVTPAVEDAQVQQICPVTGDPIDPNIYVDVHGKRIFLSNDTCKAEIEKDPEKYLAQLERQGVILETVRKPQTHCPVEGNPIDPNLFVDEGGKRIFVCAEGCVQRVKVLRVKYLRQMENLGVEVQQTARK